MNNFRQITFEASIWKAVSSGKKSWKC